MTIASRFFAGLAAFALVLAGATAVAPTPAKATVGPTTTALLVGLGLTGLIAGAVIISNDDDEPGPTSP